MDVLLVEDDPQNQQTLKRAIESEGHAVTVAENGLEAFAQAQQRDFDAIVCDIRLPFMNGIEFVERLSEENPALANRVLYITAYADDPDVRAFLERTARPFLPKPFDTAFFLSVIRDIAAGKHHG
ncbi:MAG: response regulator [Gemmatimonadales bacterium]|jgi:CheY-like chemotaxis protein